MQFPSLSSSFKESPPVFTKPYASRKCRAACSAFGVWLAGLSAVHRLIKKLIQSSGSTHDGHQSCYITLLKTGMSGDLETLFGFTYLLLCYAVPARAHPCVEHVRLTVVVTCDGDVYSVPKRGSGPLLTWHGICTTRPSVVLPVTACQKSYAWWGHDGFVRRVRVLGAIPLGH